MVSKLAPVAQDAIGTPVANAQAANSNTRRARRLVQALAAGLAASPAAASAADVVDALNTPQAQVVQVQAGDGATPPAATITEPAQTPGQLGIACITMTSPNHPIGAFIGVTRDDVTIRPVTTAAPGMAPEVPDGLNCSTFEKFETAAHARLASFVLDTADFMEGIERQLGLRGGPVENMRNPRYLDDPERAYVATHNAIRNLLAIAMRRLSEENYNTVESPEAHEEIAARHTETGNELLMLSQLRTVMPQVQQQLDDGTLDMDGGRQPPTTPDADAIPIRFESGPESARVKAAREASLRVDTLQPIRDRTATFQI
ncbi:MAG: hypothetical protein AAF556_03085 [Pseudomonadota bacterium]